MKSAIFGERPDLTCGRIIAAIGCSSISGDMEPGSISISLKSEDKGGEGKVQRGILMVKKGEFVDLSGMARDIMKERGIFIDVDMDMGRGKEEVSATAWGCDLSYDYVRINAGGG